MKTRSKTQRVVKTIVKHAVASLPPAELALGVLSIFWDPIKKRDQTWLRHLDAAIAYLVDDKCLDLEGLRDNDEFLSLIVQASLHARKTHRKEKLSTFANIVINGALNLEPDEDLLFVFLDYVDQLTPTHIHLLNYLSTLAAQGETLGGYEDVYKRYLAHNGHSMTRPHFKLFCDDLNMKKLAHLKDMHDDFDDIRGAAPVRAAHGSGSAAITDIGQRFLNLIAAPSGFVGCGL